jgi:trk system potassium uptake protein TrkH
MRFKPLQPFWLPIYFFLAGILLGTVLLHADAAHPGAELSWLDSLFTATSAMCVTGLIVVDTGSVFSQYGQAVILILIQLGGLGVMTYTSLVMYLLGRHVSLADRMAVSNTLLHDPGFSLKSFLLRIVLGAFGLELAGAACLYFLTDANFSVWSAAFHSVSAFCNAGFALQPDSLTQWQADWSVNTVFMLLIILGGLGFYVLHEVSSKAIGILSGRKPRTGAYFFSWHTSVVLKTTAFLLLGGAVIFFLAEHNGGQNDLDISTQMLVAFFNSVTCRTAGFNTVDIGGLTNVTLVFMLAFMFIGGSPGSCAGGIKTTTFRAIFAFIVSQVRGGSQARIGRFALDAASLNRALTLLIFALALVAGAVLLLEVSEGGDMPHSMVRGHFLDTLFEVVSAFGTVGLSTGITDTLSSFGKGVLIVLMFVGRLGPVWMLAALQSWQSFPKYRLPQDSLPLG